MFEVFFVSAISLSSMFSGGDVKVLVCYIVVIRMGQVTLGYTRGVPPQRAQLRFQTRVRWEPTAPLIVAP